MLEAAVGAEVEAAGGAAVVRFVETDVDVALLAKGLSAESPAASGAYAASTVVLTPRLRLLMFETMSA